MRSLPWSLRKGHLTMQPPHHLQCVPSALAPGPGLNSYVRSAECVSECLLLVSLRAPRASVSLGLGPPTALSICRSEHKANKERRRRRELCNGRAPCSLSSPPLRLTHCHWFCLPEMSPNTVYSNCLEAASKIQEIFSNNKSTRFWDYAEVKPMSFTDLTYE